MQNYVFFGGYWFFFSKNHVKIQGGVKSTQQYTTKTVGDTKISRKHEIFLTVIEFDEYIMNISL